MSLNGLNLGFSISLIVRSSILEKNFFIVSDVSATCTAAIIKDIYIQLQNLQLD